MDARKVIAGQCHVLGVATPEGIKRGLFHFLKVVGAYFEKLGSKSFAVYSIAVTDTENKTWFVKRRILPPNDNREDFQPSILAQILFTVASNVLAGSTILWIGTPKEKKEDGTTSITRTRLYLAGHTSKKNEDDPDIVEIRRMIGNDPSSIFKDLDHDPMALVCGHDRRGQLQGLGSGIFKTTFHASVPSRMIAQQEKCKS